MHYLPPRPQLEATRPTVPGWPVPLRIVVAIGTIVGISTLPTSGEPWGGVVPAEVAFTGITFLLLATIRATRVSWTYLIRRWLVFLPGLLLLGAAVIASQGVEQGASRVYWLVMKAWMAYSTLLILVQTTSVDDLLNGLGALGIPWRLRLSIALAYRYWFLFRDEFTTMRRAQQARTFRRSWGLNSPLDAPLGMAFVRSLDRAERIHAAMLARGLSASSSQSNDPR